MNPYQSVLESNQWQYLHQGMLLSIQSLLKTLKLPRGFNSEQSRAASLHTLCKMAENPLFRDAIVQAIGPIASEIHLNLGKVKDGAPRAWASITAAQSIESALILYQVFGAGIPQVQQVPQMHYQHGVQVQHSPRMYQHGNGVYQPPGRGEQALQDVERVGNPRPTPQV